MKLDVKAEAFLMVSESACSADMYYATRFLANDPFLYLNSGDEKILVSDMELGRAKKESRVKNILPASKYSLMEKLRKHKDTEAAYCEMLAEFLRSEHLEKITVPYNFSVQLADCMRKNGFEVNPLKSPFQEMREVKKANEIKAIEKAQRAGEKALSDAVKAIKAATVKDGMLWKKNAPLKAEDVRVIIEKALLSQGCEAQDIIVACGKGSANPHWHGEGELLANEPIVLDMVPRSKKERFYSDMTRTVMRGKPSKELKEMYSAVFEAQSKAIKKIKAGVTGSEIHNIVCDLFEEKGYETSRGKNGITKGFIHSTGHGVGLDIHEAPSLGESGKELKAGSVVTVEPGLYYKNVGGIRLEDVVVVTRKGCKNLTMFEKNLVLK